MDVVRIVPVPLSKEPVVLWGLRLKDLVWLAIGLAGDLLVWPHHRRWADHWEAMAVLSSGGVIMAWARYQGLSVSEWGLLLLRHTVRPKLYIAK
ncbi:MAG: hypothetical protein ACYCOU_14670 [Sulfobacillus sp.]